MKIILYPFILLGKVIAIFRIVYTYTIGTSIKESTRVCEKFEFKVNKKIRMSKKL